MCHSTDERMKLDVVADYVYLGVLQDAKGHPGCDVRKKFLSLHAVRELLSKNVFQSAKILFATKSPLFKSLALSRLTYGSGSWQHMNIHTLRHWRAQVINVYAKLASHVRRGAGTYNLDIIAACRFPRPCCCRLDNDVGFSTGSCSPR